MSGIYHLRTDVLYTLAAMLLLIIVTSASAYAAPEEEGPIVLRGSVEGFFPVSEESYRLGNASFPIASSGDGMIDSESFGLSMDAQYFFSDHFAAQASVGFLSSPEAQYNLNLFGQTFADSGKLRQYTGALAVQYYIAPYGKVRPFVGAGYGFALMDSGISGIEVDNTGGPFVHVGADWWFTEQLAVTLEVEKRWYSDSDTDYSGLAGGIPLNSTVEWDPWTLSVGIAFRL